MKEKKNNEWQKKQFPRIAWCPAKFRFAENSLSNALSLFTRFGILLHVPMDVPHFDRDERIYEPFYLRAFRTLSGTSGVDWSTRI